MAHKRYTRYIHALCAALILAGCGGEDGEGGAGPQAPASSVQESADATILPRENCASAAAGIIEAHSEAMGGFSNIGSTCYANSALKFLIHSADAKRLANHLHAFAAASNDGHRHAAQQFVKLIESTYSQAGPMREDLSNFFASLQALPAFSQVNAAGEWRFQIVGRQQDASEFLMKLSESFDLSALYGTAIALKDFNNQFSTSHEYWTVLKISSPDDSLQDIFDSTDAAGWRVSPGAQPRQLTVRIDSARHDASGTHMLGTGNFDFNQAVILHATDAADNSRLTITLEPREVIEFRGADNAGHYRVYAKDGKWSRHDDDQIHTLDQMPAIDNARLINFAIAKIETAS
ncbi:hypothetical protein [Pantoea sp. 18069]|uniref:hypothetical protein n=1 Tax=Pantoea sp. 18069 TaxID=2681415 RepID=UPI0013576D15|nr:hypothetical protein [Pantoea sp. 18069]